MNTETEPTTNNNSMPLLDNKEEASSVNLIDTSCFATSAAGDSSGISSDLAGLRMDCGDMPHNFGSFLPSQLLQVNFVFYFIEKVNSSSFTKSKI